MNKKLQVHTANLLTMIINDKHGKSEIKIPIQQLAILLSQVAERCSELNDPILNGLMCRLTLYEISNAESEDYDKAQSDAIILLGEKQRLWENEPQAE